MYWFRVRNNYHYRLDGNIERKTVNSSDTDYEYNGDIITTATGGDNFSLTWDKNGQLVLSSHEPQATSYVWNWDGKLRSATCGPNSISLKYDPAGNRIAKDVNVSQTVTARKYIVDISGGLPTILMELDESDNIMKTYVYADSQILAQHDGDSSDPRYFYLHDRLGSVRLVVDESGTVQNSYTYDAFGKTFDSEFAENISNPFKFTGQFYDSEISQYYLRARQYDPQLMRFTARDSVAGKFEHPLTLHKYLYCGNESTNKVDLNGRWAFLFGGSLSGNITGAALAYFFTDIKAFQGIGALVAYNSILLPTAAILSDHLGIGATYGQGAVVAWDHTKHFNDKDAWTWGKIQWFARGISCGSGFGGVSATGDIGISNAKRVSELSGRFVEGGGSVSFANYYTVGGSVSWGVNSDNSFNDIWLATFSFGLGTPGWEGHGYVGDTRVEEYRF
jgi:RHS repeat-associated protein